MNVWTNEHKKLWALLVLGGATIEKRRSKRAHTPMFLRTDWYLTLPLDSYLNGPFTSKGAAVLYAAEEMGVPECLIQPVRNTTTKSSLSVLPEDAAIMSEREYAPDGASYHGA